MNRPFNAFKTTITDDAFFVGHSHQLEQLLSDPCQVHVLLGGRRIGKSSTLRAVERRLICGEDTPKRAFPIFIDLKLEQPQDPDKFRYTLILRFKQALERWKAVSTSALREHYRSFLAQIASAEISVAGFAKFKISNPDQERKLGHDDFKTGLSKSIADVRAEGFSGVCFILDEAEFIVRQDWANDLWSYIRGLKDADMALQPFLGFILAGYRQVREYQQRVGSPLLNIANVEWLKAMRDHESRDLIKKRMIAENIELGESEKATVLQLSGRHPYLLQQLLNQLFDKRTPEAAVRETELEQMALRMVEFTSIFSNWWEEFGERGREVYGSVLEHGPCSDELLSSAMELSLGGIREELEVLVGTGVIHEGDGSNQFTVSCELFKTWVTDRLVERGKKRGQDS